MRTPVLLENVAVNTWLPLCRTSDLQKNSIVNIDFFDKSVDVVKKNNNVYEVFDDTCPHRGAKLSRGVVEGSCVRCPYHGMEFDLVDGKCKGFLGDYDPKKIKAKLHKHNTLLFDSLVWCYLGEGEPPEFRADKLPVDNCDEVVTEFRTIYGQTDVECNLFEVEENLLDSSHINVVHSWGNPDSLPVNTIKSARGIFFFYHHGKNSLAKWLDNTKSPQVTVYNGFAEPLSTLSRVCFGDGFTKAVRVHLLPLDDNKTRMFWGLHRNFMKETWMDPIFRFLTEKTIDEDKAILENMASQKDFKETLIEFDWIIVQYRKKIKSYLEK